VTKSNKRYHICEFQSTPQWASTTTHLKKQESLQASWKTYRFKASRPSFSRWMWQASSLW